MKENDVASRDAAFGTHPANVEVNIEKLMLTGFDRADKYRIAIAIENELARLFSERGTPSLLKKNHDISRLKSLPIALTPILNPSQIGKEVARKVYGELGL